MYKGEFKNGAMHGFGNFVWSTGKVYTGFYKKDFKEGIGMLFSKENMEIYFGFWLKGIKEGPALCIKNNEKHYAFYEKGRQLKVFMNRQEAIKFLNLYFNGRMAFKKFFESGLETLTKVFSSSTK